MGKGGEFLLQERGKENPGEGGRRIREIISPSEKGGKNQKKSEVYFASEGERGPCEKRTEW